MKTPAVTARRSLAFALLLAACSTPPRPLADASDDSGDGDGGSSDDAALDVAEDAQDAAPLPIVRATAPFVRYVDPRLGSGGSGFNVGSIYPGPQVPFGLARPSPDTSSETGAAGFSHCAGYAYDDGYIDGFSQLHLQGAGIVDYGNIGVMPSLSMDLARTTQRGRRLPFSHATERASPGLYEVTLGAAGAQIRAELTATRNVALYRFTFARGASPNVIVDTGHALPGLRVSDGAIRWDSSGGLISGHAHVQGGYSGRYGGVRAYFAARFAAGPAVRRATVFVPNELRPAVNELAGAPAPGIAVEFEPLADREQTIELRVGLSFVDVAHAEANIDAEAASSQTFDAVKSAAEREWERRLARVEVESRDPSVLRQFYTALYHAQQMPVRAQDSDGAYRALDGVVHTPSAAETAQHFTDWSLWDTFRAAQPLVAWLYPEDATQQFRSLVLDAQDTGRIDRWPLGHGMTGGMLGDSAAIVLADGLQWGLDLGDLRPAYEALKASADGPITAVGGYGGRTAPEAYARLGYVPSDGVSGSVSHTLEYSYNDRALAVLAERLGESADAARYLRRAQNYRSHWDPAQQLLVARDRAGAFAVLSDSTRFSEDYVEGNAWHYLWYAPYDVDGMAALMGGREAVLARWEQFFTRSRAERRTALPSRNYWHSNEPCLHLPWLGSALGRASASARWVRFATARYYAEGPEGLPGNDDGGTMSSWYIFAAIGLFPIAGTGEAWVGSPLVTRAVVHREGGDWVLEAPESSASAIFVRSLDVRGEAITRGVLPLSAMRGAGAVRFSMSDRSEGWGDR
ncbi:MAG: GH92 family glycosyl hydrolase [Polyangiales bacterium]